MNDKQPKRRAGATLAAMVDDIGIGPRPNVAALLEFCVRDLQEKGLWKNNLAETLKQYPEVLSVYLNALV